jgi:hypothetical protein
MKEKRPGLLLREFIGLASPRAIVTVFSGGLAFLALAPVGYLERLPLKCLFKEWIIPWVLRGRCPQKGLFEGCQCPACGITHALANLLRGNLEKAWNLNKLAFPVLLIMLGLILLNARKMFLNGSSKNKKGDYNQ